MSARLITLAALALAALACNGDDGAKPTATTTESAATGTASAGAGTESPAGGVWRTLSPMPTPRSEVAVAELNGKIYVIGGFEADGSPSAKVEVYDPETHAWSEASPLPEARHHATAIAFTPRVDVHRLLVAGGFNPGFEDPKANVFEYDDLTDSWSENPPLQTARGGLAVTTYERVLFVVGGAGRASDGQVRSLSSVEVMNFSSREWLETDEPLAVPRDHLAAGTVMGFGGGGGYPRVHVIGGRSNLDYSRNLNANEEGSGFDSWDPAAPVPTARSGIAAAAFDLPGVGYQIYVFGGEGPEGTFDTVEVYDRDKDTWSTAPPMPTARHGLGAAVVGDTIYVIGGGETPGLSVSGANEAFTP